MKKGFYVSPIGQPIFWVDEQEHQSAHKRTDAAFNWSLIGAAAFLLVVQVFHAAKAAL
ncbi:hypothetical protein ICN48_05575 [Polynucleobacter sp. JS-Safj-400b-B2]|uniref:hypothetical protein n=1 Tax=Polynucleobacter sp. JS-Safj-400b-B2 TaxID=2576921 RepID=UPI001C0E10B5|nr:hypothetical protein [Polynucleobacter sp. JS-Safj-400b-B2]MBU3625703.1 hypothetical protein [Polynucleobacter sp. JS-Safj-400b-B2]